MIACSGGIPPKDETPRHKNGEIAFSYTVTSRGKTQ